MREVRTETSRFERIADALSYDRVSPMATLDMQRLNPGRTQEQAPPFPTYMKGAGSKVARYCLAEVPTKGGTEADLILQSNLRNR